MATQVCFELFNIGISFYVRFSSFCYLRSNALYTNNEVVVEVFNIVITTIQVQNCVLWQFEPRRC